MNFLSTSKIDKTIETPPVAQVTQTTSPAPRVRSASSPEKQVAERVRLASAPPQRVGHKPPATRIDPTPNGYACQSERASAGPQELSGLIWYHQVTA